MSDRKERQGWETWYPLTYPGYYTADLSKVHSFRHECCRLDLSRYQGRTVGFRAVSDESEGLCSLTDAEGRILEQWKAPPAVLSVPENALHLYLNNDFVKNSDFCVLVPFLKEKNADGFLFDHDFTDGASLDGNDFFGDPPAKICTSRGLVLPLGIGNAVVLNTSAAIDRWSLTAELLAPEGTEIVCLGTRSTQERNCPHASLCRLDLAADELILYRAGKGKEIPQEVLERISLGGQVKKGNLSLRLERIDQVISACVTAADGKEYRVTRELMVKEDPPASVAGACRAGKMYDSPQIFALSGAPVLRRLYAKADTSPKAVFFGDSITQGAHNLPHEGWAQMCASAIGHSLCCGRGSGDIWSCLNQVRSLIPVFRPKVMVITIGTNNLENKVSTETVKGLYDKFIAMARHWKVKLIVNCIPVCSRSHIEETNRILRALDVPGSRFDTAFTVDHAEGGEQELCYFVKDGVHLNPEGNRVLYELFMQDFPWLLNL